MLVPSVWHHIFRISYHSILGQNGRKCFKRQYFGGSLGIGPGLFDFLWIHRNARSEWIEKATEMAILNANYISKRLEGAYDILYTGDQGRTAHELIIDCRPFKNMILR